MNPERLTEVAGEYYLNLDPMERIGQLREVESEIAETAAETAELNQRMNTLQEHRLAIMFVIRAANVQRVEDDLG